MSYEYTLTGSAPANIDEKQKARENILSIRERLIAIGYNEGETDYLLKKFGRGKRLNELGLSELLELKKAMQTHLDIAQKCMEIV